MKSSNTVVTIVVIAAVLVAAYAVGLLIRQARVGETPSPASRPAEVGTARPGPAAKRTQDSQEAKAQLKEKRAEALKKMESATPEQKAQFREQVRERVSGSRDEKGTGGESLKPAAAAGVPQVQDPNTKQSSGKSGSEPNRTGQN